MDQIIFKHSCLQLILTDNGTNFSSNLLACVNKLMRIRGELTTPYYPESNKTIERVNGTIEAILRRIILDNPAKWSTMVQSAAFAYNIGFHSSTGYTPFLLLYGRHPSLPPLLYSILKESEEISYGEYLRRLANLLIAIQADAYENIYSKKLKAYERASKDRTPLSTLSGGKW